MGQTQKISRNNTTVKRTADGVTVRLHSTDVVTVKAGMVTLDSGGWQTVTTKARMNQTSNELGLGFGVTQKDGKWTVSTGGKTLPFVDGMTFPLEA